MNITTAKFGRSTHIINIHNCFKLSRIDEVSDKGRDSEEISVCEKKIYYTNFSV